MARAIYLFDFAWREIEADPMAKTVSLQTAIKLFKKRLRKVALHCVTKQDEWFFQTCQARSNRMGDFAIPNRHAAIRGMPKLSEEDAKQSDGSHPGYARCQPEKAKADSPRR